MSERGVGPLRAAARGVRDASHRHLLDQVVLHLHGRRLRERRRLEPARREEPKSLGCVRVVALERVAPPHLRRRRLRHRQVAARLLHQTGRAAASTNTTSTAAQVELERPAKPRERHRLHDEDRMSAVVVVVAAQARAAHLRGAAAAHAGPHAASPRLAVAWHAHLRHRILVLAGRFPVVLVEERRGLAVAVDDLERRQEVVACSGRSGR